MKPVMLSLVGMFWCVHVHLLKTVDDAGEKRTRVEELIMPWLAARNLVIVVEMYEFQCQLESVV